MKIHHTIQFYVADATLEYALLGCQLFATDMIAYAFQIDKAVCQIEGKKYRKEDGYGCKWGIFHASVNHTYYTYCQ